MKRQHQAILASLLALPAVAQAYVGPGMGFGVIASLLALGSAFFVTLWHFIVDPLLAWLKKQGWLEKDKPEANEGQDNDEGNDNPQEDRDNSGKPGPGNSAA